jgi:hypothetical protein
MMEVSKRIEIMNLYDWLPSFGESEVNFRSNDLNVIIEVTYEKEKIADGVRQGEVYDVKRELIFTDVVFFHKSTYPTLNFLDVHYDAKSDMGNNKSSQLMGTLAEFGKSEYVELYSQYWHIEYGREAPKLKHYNLKFNEVEMSFHILARGFELSGELSV